MIKIGIIEDEEIAQANLTDKLKDCSVGISSINCVSTYKKGLDLLINNCPDVVFLDIELDEKSGLELLKEVGPCSTQVILTTAYDQHAIEAFKLNTIDYLLKPIDTQELENSLMKAKNNIRQNKICSLISILDYKDIGNRNDSRKEGVGKIGFPTLLGYSFYKADEIIRFKADANYTKLFLLGGKQVIISKAMNEIEKLVENHSFYRVHHSHIINLSHVVKFTNGVPGILEMSDGSNALVSKRRKTDFLRLFNLKK